MRNESQTNRLLGYPADARLLIVNADDFGMCHAVNTAVIHALPAGILRSTTLMVPCPWALHAIHFLQEHPELPFGVHLTAISEWVDYRWGPITPREKVPSLVDEAGYFYNFAQMPHFLAQVNLVELALEFRAQIDTVLAAGLKPTHLDWHCLRLGGRDDIWALLFRLAREYGLALRVMGRSWVETVQSQGFPTNDYDFLDSYLLDPMTKASRYLALLRELPVGLSEWAIHPGLDSSELRTIDPGGFHIRQTDLDFLTSPQAKEVIAAEGIILLDYRALHAIWQEK
jgi:chitin disaccharide deacetylase